MSARVSSSHEHAPFAVLEGAHDPRAELARRIERLRTDGADQWDAPAFALLVSLQERVERDRTRASRALSWALERCEILERWMAEMRCTLVESSARASMATGASQDVVRAALNGGDLASAQVLLALAELRQPRAPSESGERPRGIGDGGGRIEASLLAARTAVVSAQAHAAGGEATGPYNPRALAGKLLATLDDLAPQYLRACVSAFDDLAALQLLEVETNPPRPRKRSRSRD